MIENVRYKLAIKTIVTYICLGSHFSDSGMDTLKLDEGYAGNKKKITICAFNVHYFKFHLDL